MAVREALRGDARRGDRLVLRGKAAPGEEQAFAALRNEAAVGNLVVVVEQPFNTRLCARVQLDRPGRARNAVGRLSAFYNILIGEKCRTAALARLAHADLHAGVVDPALLAAGEVLAEEARVLAHLPAAFDLGVGEVGGEKRIQLAPVATDDARAIAKQLPRARGGEEPDLGARQEVALAVVAAQKLGHLLRHDGVRSVGPYEALGIYAAEAENHRRVLHAAAHFTFPAHEGRQPRHGEDVRIAARVDGDLAPDADRPLLRVRDQPLDSFPFQQHTRYRAVEEHLHAGFARQMVGGLAPDERVVHAGPGLAVTHRRR